MRAIVALLILAAGASGCTQTDPVNPGPTTPAPGPAFKVSSDAFADGGDIPEKYRWSRCTGQVVPLPGLPGAAPNEVSPPLRFENVPEGTKSFALLMDDPDANGFVHWRFWNLPAQHTNLAEDADVRSMGAEEGQNGFGERGYGGPCPPSRHQYVFTVHAVSEEKVSGWAAVASTDLATATLTGYYG